jgi:hypothetical protein
MEKSSSNEKRARAWMDLRLFLVLNDPTTLVTGPEGGPGVRVTARDLDVLDRLFPTPSRVRATAHEPTGLEALFRRLEWA